MNERTFFVSRPSQAEAAAAFLMALPTEPPIRVVIGPIPRGPTPEQHRRYRQLCRLMSDLPVKTFDPETGEITGEERYSAEAWHIYFKQQYLDPVVIVLPDGKRRHDLPSTADVQPDRMEDFIWHCKEFAGERGIFLTPPEER